MFSFHFGSNASLMVCFHYVAAMMGYTVLFLPLLLVSTCSMLMINLSFIFYAFASKMMRALLFCLSVFVCWKIFLKSSLRKYLSFILLLLFLFFGFHLVVFWGSFRFLSMKLSSFLSWLIGFCFEFFKEEIQISWWYLQIFWNFFFALLPPYQTMRYLLFSPFFNNYRNKI